MGRILTGIIALLAIAAAPGNAQPLHLEPSGPWKVDYAEGACTLSRPFSVADQVYLLAVTFEPIERLAWLRVGSKDRIERRDDGNARVEVDGMPLDHPVHFNVFPSLASGTVREFMFKDFSAEIAGTKQALRLQPGKYGDLNFSMQGFPKAMEAAKLCVADLHRSLGIDSSVLSSIAVPPEGMSLSFVSYSREEGGLDITLLYWVTETGAVDECRVLTPSGHQKFDATVCDQLKAKGRFKPARNARGEPIRAPVYDNIRLRTATIISSTPL